MYAPIVSHASVWLYKRKRWCSADKVWSGSVTQNEGEVVVKCCIFGGIVCRKLLPCVTRSSRHTMPPWCRLAIGNQVASR